MKKLLVYIITLSVVFINITGLFFSVPVKAAALDVLVEHYDDIKNELEKGGQTLPENVVEFIKQNLGVGGFIYKNKDNMSNWLADQLRGYSTGGVSFGDQNDSDQEVLNNAANYLVNNISKSGNTFTYNDNSRNVLNYIANSYANESGFLYVHSFDLVSHVSHFPDGVLYNALRSLILSNQNDYICTFYANENKVFLFPIDVGLVRYSNYSYGFYCRTYDYNTWELTNSEKCYIYDSSISEFVLDNSIKDNVSVASDSGITLGNIAGGNFVYTVNADFVYKMYLSLNDLKESQLGISHYYISSNWQNFVSGSGNYTLDSSNSNNVTYGDVNNYINNYYGDNGNYPDPTQIQVYIDNNIVTPDPTPTPTPNPDDPGGGGGSDDDPTFDLGFLGTIGRLIGSLITGIGNLITGILEGIVNALTGILSFLTTLITDIADVMPQGIMDLFSAILGWLPQEWITVMSLGILSMVLIGVFKIFK